MNEVIKYEVVLFQHAQEGVVIFQSKDLEQCKTFAKKERKQFDTFLQNGFPLEALPTFGVAVYYSDGSREFLAE